MCLHIGESAALASEATRLYVPFLDFANRAGGLRQTHRRWPPMPALGHAIRFGAAHNETAIESSQVRPVRPRVFSAGGRGSW